MAERIFFGWRLIATALCFVLFGVGGLLMRFVYFPILALLIGTPDKRVSHARFVIRIAFRSYVAVMHQLGVLRFHIIGVERLQRSGLLVLANHPSLIDTVFLMALVPDADCIVKANLQTNFFTHGPITAAGYIRNDHGMELVDDCIASLRQGSNLIVFPEGTRTPADGAIQMKRGAANIAVRAQADITPVVIRCTPRTLIKGQKWWLIPTRQVHFTIEVKDDIMIAQFIDNADPEGQGGHEARAARKLTDYLQTYFNEEIQRHA